VVTSAAARARRVAGNRQTWRNVDAESSQLMFEQPWVVPAGSSFRPKCPWRLGHLIRHAVGAHWWHHVGVTRDSLLQITEVPGERWEQLDKGLRALLLSDPPR
jgi:hypothetical protein